MRKMLLVSILFIILIILIEIIVSKKAYGVDLGTWGESSVIAEEDFETHIIKQLESLGDDKIHAVQEQIKNKVVANIKRPTAVKGIAKAKANSSRLYDPSFILNENIYNDQKQLLYPSGTKINPLEKRSFEEVWLFIDGDDLAQVEFAKNYQEDDIQTKKGQSSIEKVKKVILLNGSPGTQQDGSFFFFDQAGSISKKLSINKVPSIVRQAPGISRILIEEIALDNEESLYEKTS